MAFLKQNLSFQSFGIQPGVEPGSPYEGQIYFNASDGKFYVYADGAFRDIAGIIQPTGGIKTAYTDSGTDYIVHTFLTSGVFISEIARDVDALLVASGGGGGSGRGGGGGAGGMVYRAGFGVTAQGYAITIGAGGSGSTEHNTDPPTNGNDTVAFSVTAKGGGAGGSGVIATQSISIGKTGGSAGGTTHGADGAIASNQGSFTGWTVKGNAGGNGNGSTSESAGGGGGAGAAGQAGDASGNGGDGGVGFQNDYQTGSNQYYAGGGGGGFGGGTGVTSGDGGNGGGGNGTAGAGQTATGDAIAGTLNTGGGGGGGSYTGSFDDTENHGQDGGSGIVVIRYTA